MPSIFDNIDPDLSGPLRATLSVSKQADFCVGDLNLRGWPSDGRSGETPVWPPSRRRWNPSGKRRALPAATLNEA